MDVKVSKKDTSSGDSAKIGSSGNSAQIDMTGESSIATSCGLETRGRVGKLGCLVLARWVEEEKRYRASIGYEGENITEGVWYKLDNAGNFVEAA